MGITPIQAVRLTPQSKEERPADSSAEILVTPHKRWQECLELIQEALPAQTFQTWFAPIIAVSALNGTLTLRIPSRFFFEWLDSHHGDMLRNTVAAIFGEETQIEFLVASKRESQPPAPLEEPDQQSEEVLPVSTPAVPVQVPQRRDDRKCDVNHQYKLNGFVCNRDHELPARAARFVAMHSSSSEYNPLVIHGDIGSGKTHLLHAIGNEVLSLSEDKRVTVYTGERFLHNYIYALQSGAINQFVNSLISADVFLLDDLHALAGKTKSQEMLIFIFSELIKRGSQIVLSVNQSPCRLSNFNPALVSFCEKGLIVDLLPYECESREEIIRYYLKDNGIHLDENIILFLAENLDHNLHHLNAVMIRIIAQVSLLGKGMRLEQVRLILAQLCPYIDGSNVDRPMRRHVTIEDIINVSAKYFNLPADILQGVSRKSKIMRARQITIYICRELTGESLSSIGYHFSNLHHASVLYAYNKIVRELKADMLIKSAVQKIRGQLAN